jgi:hypothetical protein
VEKKPYLPQYAYSPVALHPWGDGHLKMKNTANAVELKYGFLLKVIRR